MYIAESPLVKESSHLLQNAEAAFPSTQSTSLYKEAFELLDDLQMDGPERHDIKQYIGNMRFAYFRSIINNLHRIDLFAIDLFIDYFIIIVVVMSTEFNIMKSRKPRLYATYTECKSRFQPQLDEIVEALSIELAKVKARRAREAKRTPPSAKDGFPPAPITPTQTMDGRQ